MNVGGGTTRLIIGIVIGLVLGVALGALLFYQLFPVQWTNANTYDLSPQAKAQYISLVADSYRVSRNPAIRQEYLSGWRDDEIQQGISDAIQEAEAEARTDRVQALRDLEMVLGLTGEVVTPGATAMPVSPEPPVTPSLINRLRVPCLIFLVVLLVLVLASIAVRVALSRRSAAAATTAVPAPAETVGAVPSRRAPVTRPVVPEVTAPEEWEGVGQPPLGHFITTYKLGEDTYDESFSIETPAGEFLGECGVGISETIGRGEPDKVTAFEVWLFDKSDIRTVTKVLMSDFAFHDEALRSKLTPKGEAILAQVGVPFVLETSGLQVQATVTDLVYGEGDAPAKSFFRQLTVELVGTAKSPVT